MDHQDDPGLKAIDKFYEEIVEIYPELGNVAGLHTDIHAVIQEALDTASREER
jgi:hypothetical protein